MSRPKALCLRHPEWVGADYLEKLREQFELHVRMPYALI